jgi:hypothetical protein
MCQISLIGATGGGFAGRKYYYILEIRQINDVILHLKDKNQPQKSTKVSQSIYQSMSNISYHDCDRYQVRSRV